ncbi:MAG: hypothetical protein ACK5MN_12335 [Lachnospiraceae bacterium]
MPNTIALAKSYTDLLDEVYKKASVTADLTGDPHMVRAGANAREILYPQISTSGLGDYDRTTGYTDGSVNLEWVTTEYNYDRGTKISVDTMDDQETFNLAYGMAGSTLQREKVAPEADAFTFATLAGITGISKVDGTYANADAFLAALLEAKNTMDEGEVPEEGRILYATSTLLNSLLMLETYKSKEVLAAYTIKKSVPQSRFYTAIDLLDGKTPGEELGHFQKATSAKDINFMIIHKPAIIKHDKHVVGSVISPDQNQNADAYMVKYRKYGIVDVYKNKKKGIYLSHKA